MTFSNSSRKLQRLDLLVTNRELIHDHVLGLAVLWHCLQLRAKCRIDLATQFDQLSPIQPGISALPS